MLFVKVGVDAPFFEKKELQNCCVILKIAKEQFALHHYCHSLQKEQWERFAPATLYKKRERAICSF